MTERRFTNVLIKLNEVLLCIYHERFSIEKTITNKQTTATSSLQVAKSDSSDKAKNRVVQMFDNFKFDGFHGKRWNS